MTAPYRPYLQFCTDCQAGNCRMCLERGPQLDDGTVCECEHDDLDDEGGWDG